MIIFWSWWWEVKNPKDELACMILTIFIPLLILLWCKWILPYARNKRYPTARLPPGPYGLPVVGYLPFLGADLHEIFTKMAHNYGPIFSLWLGSKLHVVVNSIDLVKVVACEQDHTFANRNSPITARALTYDGSDIAWSNNNTHWRNMRKLLATKVLSSANLDASRNYRTEEVRRTIKDVYTKIGTHVNINTIAFNTEVNVVTSMLWGSSKSRVVNDFSYTGDRFREVEYAITELLGKPDISDFIPILSWFDLQGRLREMKQLRDHLYEIFDKIILERIDATKGKLMEGEVEDVGRKDFLQILLELKDQKDAPTSFNLIEIKALLMDIVTAATDTTSTMVEWVMAEILHNPDVMKKVQDELTAVFGMNIVDEDHLHKLSYLDAVIKETYRLHPPLPLLIQRCPDESCIVGGYTIPKGTIVFMNIWAIQRDPKNWTCPLEFKPERFLNQKWDYNGNNFKFLPFGSGRRRCPGIPLGEKMLMYILASLFHSFDWSLPENEDFELSDKFAFVVKKRKPLIAIPSQRLSDASLNFL